MTVVLTPLDPAMQKVHALAAKGYSVDAISRIVGRTVPERLVRDVVTDRREGASQRREKAEWDAAFKRAEAIAARNRERMERLRSSGLMEIVEREAALAGVLPIELLSDSRTRGLTEPRFGLYYAAAVETDLSLAEIGRQIGRDHTSIIHGIRQHARVIPADQGPDPIWRLGHVRLLHVARTNGRGVAQLASPRGSRVGLSHRRSLDPAMTPSIGVQANTPAGIY